MTIRDQLRKIANQARTIPNAYGLRPYRVYVVTSASTGAEPGYGTTTETSAEITNAGAPPKVRWLTDEQRTLGDYATGTVRIGPITPDYPGGGTALSALKPTLGASDNDTLLIRLVGPEYPSGALYRVTKWETDRGLQYSMVCERAA